MRLPLLAPLFVLPLLAACAPELDTSVSTGDLERVAETSQSLDVTALLRIPQPSFAECTANLLTLRDRLETLVPVATEPTCVAIGLDSFAVLRTPLALIPFEAKPADRLAAIVALPTNSGATDLAFRLLQPFGDIFYTLAADISPRPRLDATIITVSLRNDGSEPLTLLAGGAVLVDGKESPRESTLAAGQTVELRLTPVAAGLIESNIDYTFASFSRR